MDKTLKSPDDAVARIRDGSSIAIAGFGMPGAPVHLMRALIRSTVTDVELISNNGALFDWQLGPLLNQGRVRRIIASHIGLNRTLEKAYRDGIIEVELVPQGTLIERLRAAGAGIPAFFSPAGVDTLVQYGGLAWRYGPDGEVVRVSPPKRTEVFGGRTFLLEEAITPDVALVRAARGDRFGNLVFHQSARNFNPVWARAAVTTIAEVEQLVEPGEIDPDAVHLAGAWVDHVVEVGTAGKCFELPPRASATGAETLDPATAERHVIARRAAQEFQDGAYVNLGVGIPTLAAHYMPEGVEAFLHSENGVIGLGPAPANDAGSFDLTDASKQAATIEPGGAFMDSADAFALIRGGRLDLTILGAMQVSQNGDLANWVVPGRAVAGMGGAMDLVAGARRVVVATVHTEPSGRPKIVESCTYPLTGAGVVDRIITNLAVLDVTTEGLVLRELAPGVTVETVLSATAARVLVPAPPRPMAGVG